MQLWLKKVSRHSLTWLVASVIIVMVGASSVFGASPTTHTVLSTPDHVIWGELFKPNSTAILKIKSGDRLTLETVSHEGILADQGDTVEFFTKAGIAEKDILKDQTIVKSQVKKTGPGPHVITGPIYIEGAEPGDVLAIKTLNIDYRSPYGVISNRHSKGSLPGEYPENGSPIYTKVIPIDIKREIGIFRPSNGKPNIELALKPFMGIMGVVPANPEDAVNSVPPGKYGGNVDIKLLSEGSNPLSSRTSARSLILCRRSPLYSGEW